MGFVIRAAKFVYGFFLFLYFHRTVKLDSILNGKRVAIVGAADSALHTGKGDFIDGYDVVIRVNKGAWMVHRGKWTTDIGRKTDLLFHSFFENEKSGGGELDFKMFDSLGIQFVINPIAAYPGYRVTFNFYKKYLSKRITYSPGRSWYKRLTNDLNGFRPTIGYCALMSILLSDFNELYVTGFTFFRTAFGDGYRDQIKEVSQAKQHILEVGLHDPDLELQLFVKKLREFKSNKVIMDDALRAIVNDISNGR